MTRSFVVVTLLLLLSSSVAQAQIFNVQPLLDKQSRDGFSGALEGAADWRSGNTNILMLTGNGVVQYRKQRHLVFIDVHGEYGLQGTNELVSKDLEHARYRYRLSRAIDFEAFVQHDADAFRRLAVRAVAGVGARLRLVEGKHVTLAVAGAYMPDYERLSAGLFPDSRAQSLAHRLSTYAVIAVSQGKIMVAHTIYAQPRADSRHRAHRQATKRVGVMLHEGLEVDGPRQPVAIARVLQVLRDQLVRALQSGFAVDVDEHEMALLAILHDAVAGEHEDVGVAAAPIGGPFERAREAVVALLVEERLHVEDLRLG